MNSWTTAEMLGTEPYICVNLGTGTWTEAQQWVEYVNSSQDTAMTRLRKENGRQEPWKVTYWGLGNEMDGPWQMGHRTADDYGKFALEAAKLMKWTDPNIKLIAAGSSHFAPGDRLDRLEPHGPRTPEEPHRLPGDSPLCGQPRQRLLRIPHQFGRSRRADQDDRRRDQRGDVRRPRNRRIYIAWDEWNVWYRARGAQQRGRRILEERYNLEDALVVATFLNSFVNHAHIIKMANMAQLVNVIAPIFTNEKGMFLQTIYYPLQLFANNTKGKALELFVESSEVREQAVRRCRTWTPRPDMTTERSC